MSEGKPTRRFSQIGAIGAMVAAQIIATMKNSQSYDFGNIPAGHSKTFQTKRNLMGTSGFYIPAGPHCNTRGTFVRNPKIAAHIIASHEAWERKFDARQVRHANGQ